MYSEDAGVFYIISRIRAGDSGLSGILLGGCISVIAPGFVISILSIKIDKVRPVKGLVVFFRFQGTVR